ncbi:leupaxin isoform X2 [Vespula squamosa]|uniref:Leupaxin isoform X2 n=1 Tax=Vespula squamosa TaxID=30214 RepID=A0ABD2A733_VESSQ
MTDVMRPMSPVRLATIQRHARWEQYVRYFPKNDLAAHCRLVFCLSSSYQEIFVEDTSYNSEDH